MVLHGHTGPRDSVLSPLVRGQNQRGRIDTSESGSGAERLGVKGVGVVRDIPKKTSFRQAVKPSDTKWGTTSVFAGGRVGQK